MKKIKRLDVMYVTIQFVLLVVFYTPIISYSLPLPHIVTYSGVVIATLGFLIILIAILQLSKNLTPFPSPKESGRLIKTGLYKFIRHPIYSGVFLTTFGIALYSCLYWQLSVSFILLVLFYFKSKYEESLLIQKYPDYKNYMNVTRRFF